jgi:hypothetical protein
MRLVLVPAHGALHLSHEGVAAVSYRRWASLAASNPASSLEKYEIGRRSGSASVRSAGGPRLSLPGGMLWDQGFSRPDYLPRYGATGIKQPWGLLDARASRALRPHSFSLLASHRRTSPRPACLTSSTIRAHRRRSHSARVYERSRRLGVMFIGLLFATACVHFFRFTSCALIPLQSMGRSVSYYLWNDSRVP